jgi:uncharacterized protein (DUF2252 family)
MTAVTTPPRRRPRRDPKHPTTAERIALGRAARKEVPRLRHAAVELPADRPDPVALLERQAESRVPELVPIRYGRMLVSPFTFYRGAAAIMAADLAAGVRTSLRVQLCGDAHLSNFGVFGSPERRLVFDINDFDETLPGPWEWDVKRLAVSLEVAGRDNGFGAGDRREVVRRGVWEYRTAMRQFAPMRNLEVWYASMDVDTRLSELRAVATRKQVRRTEQTLAKARTRDSMHAFSKLTHMVDGEPRIISDPPLIEPIEDLAEGMEAEELTGALHDVLRAYRKTLPHDRKALLEQYRLVHVARKVVGVGSVGTRAWIALMLGRDEVDPLFLQIKEAQPSVLEDHCGKSVFANCGERVVAGQRMMQASSDIFLGWTRIAAGFDGVRRDFYGRQLKDWKGSAVIETMTPRGMMLYAGMCGWTLARGHARSGDRVAIAAYLGNGDTFDRAICDFADAYADLNERDYKALAAAVDSGRIAAAKGL